MKSVADIKNAQDLLVEYCSDQELYAWPLYDFDPAPHTLSGVDLTAPALLSYPIKGRHLNQMGKRGTPHAELAKEMRSVLNASPQRFWEIDSHRIRQMAVRERFDNVEDDAWGHLTRCLDRVNEIDDLTSVFVTKVLHRKRPDLVPINDSLVQQFYGVDGKDYPALFSAVHTDLTDHLDLLETLGSSIKQTDTTLGPLRVLDIVIWMHKKASG